MKKNVISSIFISLFCLLLTVPAFAMEPLTHGFRITNIGDADVEIRITETGTDETTLVMVPAKETVIHSCTFTEPETREFLVENSSAESEDPSYRVWLSAEVNEEGNLQGYTVSQIVGTKEKPAELTFGSPPTKITIAPPDQPGTGDHSQLSLWIWIGIGAGCIAAISLVLALRNKKD